tara:strand:- start:529 stop:1602 length:1074 start_codon:yes stop_codon:yes gene_type:complete
MADNRYVSSGYVSDSYVISTEEATASLSSSFTLSLSPALIKADSTSINLKVALGTDLTWSEMGTWKVPIQPIWGPLFTVDGLQFFGAEPSLTSSFSLSVDPIATFSPTISFTPAFTASITAVAIVSGETLHAGTFSMSVTGQKIANPEPALTSTSTLSSTAYKTVYPSPALTCTFTFDVDGGILLIGETLHAGTFSLSADPIATFRATVPDLTFTSSLYANPKADAYGESLNAGTFTLSVSATKTVYPEPALTSTFTLSPTAYKTVYPTFAFTGPFSTLVVGVKWAIDPFRVHLIPSETRINILEQETRNFAINSDTRINIVPQETRSKTIASETRKLEIQHLTLVDDPGIKDRRTG